MTSTAPLIGTWAPSLKAEQFECSLPRPQCHSVDHATPCPDTVTSETDPAESVLKSLPMKSLSTGGKVVS